MKRFDENYIKNLPDCYNKDPTSNHSKIMQLLRYDDDNFRSLLEELLDSLDLDKARGHTLDLYGEMVGQNRGVATDEQYLVLIKAKIERNRCEANIQSIANALCRTLNCEPSEFCLKDSDRRIGKNLFDPDTAFTNNMMINSSGEEVSSPYYMHSDYIPVQPNTTYSLSGVATPTSSTYVPISCYSADKTFLGRITSAMDTDPIFTTPEECYYIRFNASESRYSSGKIAFSYTLKGVKYNLPVQLERGGEATAYEEYTETIISGAVVLESLPLAALNRAGLSATQAVAIITSMLPVGVRLEHSVINGTFEFGDAMESDEAAGFGDIEQSVGGYFGYLASNDVVLPV